MDVWDAALSPDNSLTIQRLIPPLKPYEWDVAVEPYKSFPLPNTVGYVANFVGCASEWQKHTFRSRI